MNPDTAARPQGVPPPAFRLPAATSVGPVHLQVSDLPRSLDFYQRVIGLRASDTDGDTAVLAAHGDDRPLVVLHGGAAVTRGRRGAFGLYHFALLLPERAALGRFAAHLAGEQVRVSAADHLVSEALYLWDPDGLGIEVYVDRPRSTWRFQGSELVMTTDPLDMDGVVAAAGGAPWRRAPAGTTMGHVHLHVGSLADAEAFYHRALGFDKTVWSYPGALFLSAGGYHHHLGTNVWSPGPAPDASQARLLEWELVVPSPDDLTDVARSLRDAGCGVDESARGVRAADPWGTVVHVRSAA
jgi:catechol 2,3-dioxygenase